MKLIIRNFIRIFQRFRLAMSLNILGLIAAFVAFLLLMMQWNFDREFDRSDPNAESIFRIDMAMDNEEVAVNSRPMAEMLMQASPHIQAGVLMSSWSGQSIYFIESANGTDERRSFREAEATVTEGLSDVFHFEMKEGTTECLHDVKNLLIPESMAERWFGGKSAVGKVVLTERGTSYTVGGVYKDFPLNNSLKNIIYSSMGDENKDQWQNSNYTFYLRTDLTDAEVMQEIVDDFFEREEVKKKMDWDGDLRLVAVPLVELHAYRPVLYDNTPRASHQTMLLIFSIAIAVLLIAGINFTNFNTAISPLRMKSINTQKVLGATNGRLRLMLLIESVLICLLAYGVALFTLYYIQDTPLNQLIRADIHLASHPYLLLITAGVAVVVGLVSGVYPAYYTTSFEPALVLKGSFRLSPKGRMLRSVLMSFQFIVSFVLIIGALFMYLQNRYSHTASLGFDKDALIMSDMSSQAAKEHDVLRNNLLKHSEIAGVGFARDPLGNENDLYSSWGREYQGKTISFNCLNFSVDLPEVLGLHVLEGRNFRDGDGQGDGRFLINRKMADEYGIQVGDRINGTEVVGIVPDFLYRSMRLSNAPTALMTIDSNYYGSPYAYLYVKIAQGVNMEDAIRIIRQELTAISPDYPFDVRFFDSILNQLYQDEERMMKLISLFNVSSI